MSNLNSMQEKLNLTFKNLSLISDNYANINTPGYQRKYIDVTGQSFQSVLDTSLKKTRNKHIDASYPKAGSILEEDYMVRTDKNGVSADKEVLEMQKNKLFYNSLITMINGDLSKTKNIITSK